jgi:hypothetical protein
MHRYRTILATLQEPQLLLLDAYPNSVGAYSLRKLKSDYSGSCIQVRRLIDNVLQDIGFADNELDTASLLSFIGSGDGVVRTWYDQSGNNNHAFNINTNAHPRIVTSGVIVTNPDGIISLDFTLGGNRLLTFTSGTTFRNVNYGAVFSVYQNSESVRRDVIGYTTSTSTTGRILLSDGLGISNRETIASRRLDSDSLTVLNSTTNYTSATKIVTGVVNWGSGSSLLKRNGSVIATSSTHGTAGFTSDTNSAISNNTLNNSAGIGAVFTSGTVKFISEIVLYNTNQDSNITGIETNINNFYNIY